MKVLVCGSRVWENVAALVQRLDSLPRDTLIIHGGASGADKLADKYARQMGLQVLEMPADWKTHEGCQCTPRMRMNSVCKWAGKRRNLAMLDEQPDLVIAFWDGQSRGTAHTIDEATKRGIPVEVVG